MYAPHGQPTPEIATLVMSPWNSRITLTSGAATVTLEKEPWYQLRLDTTEPVPILTIAKETTFMHFPSGNSLIGFDVRQPKGDPSEVGYKMPGITIESATKSEMKFSIRAGGKSVPIIATVGP